MVIRVFTLVLLTLSIISYFIPIESSSIKSVNKDIALLTFNDSTMYTLTTESMNRIIYSKELLRYKDRDVLYEGALTLKGKDNNKEVIDILFADKIIKKDDNFEFLNNVKYKRDDYITLNTDELLYNSKIKIAKNTLPFEGTYFNNYIKGENIYLDLNNYYLKASNTHFEVEVE